MRDLREEVSGLKQSVDAFKASTASGIQVMKDHVEQLATEQTATKDTLTGVENKLQYITSITSLIPRSNNSQPIKQGQYANMDGHPVYRNFHRSLVVASDDIPNSLKKVWKYLEKRVNDSGFKEHWPPLKQQQYLVEAKDFLLQVALQLQHDCKADLDTNWPDLDVEKRTKAIRDFELYCSNIFPFELFQASVPKEGNDNTQDDNTQNDNADNSSSVTSMMRSQTSEVASQVRQVSLQPASTPTASTSFHVHAQHSPSSSASMFQFMPSSSTHPSFPASTPQMNMYPPAIPAAPSMGPYPYPVTPTMPTNMPTNIAIMPTNNMTTMPTNMYQSSDQPTAPATNNDHTLMPPPPSSPALSRTMSLEMDEVTAQQPPAQTQKKQRTSNASTTTTTTRSKKKTNPKSRR
ncbi:hypothetical protein O0I10_012276 [Lichtheimia ornata]|uniref:Uncharacterized protein n=1 Tax=Lichtheimia ornata TaxID=688661 RepID=A0AAD7UTN3_9FUNG|nr:uncharacterized protein O0I10_012276 [Lichtheimia ornata]KAJ8652091.1 hypothetical protein O0I10_012276 [Lichtheimia ornata]